MSSYIRELLEQCPQVQEDLNNAFAMGTLSKGVLNESLPFLEQVVSSQQAFASQTVFRGNGKLRTLQVIYTPQITESEVTENVANPNCVATTVRGNLSETYTIDPAENVGAEQLIPHEQVRYNCGSNPQYFLDVMARLIDATERKVATKTVQEAAALTGTWAPRVGAIPGMTLTSDELVFATLLGTTGNFDPMLAGRLKRAFRDSLYQQDALIFSGGDLFDYSEALQIGCCNDGGLDLSAALSRHGMGVFYDKRVQDVFGSDESIAFRPGALALLYFAQSSWLDNVMEQVRQGATYVSFTVNSPRTGLPYDVTIKDDCGQVSINIVATTKLVAPPADMFAVNSEYAGINFVNVLKVANS
jgi:hypothetical protein